MSLGGPMRSMSWVAFLALALAQAAPADDTTTYVPVTRASQPAQGQGASAAGQFQTPGDKKGLSSDEIIAKAKEKLAPEQYEAFEKALKKIDPTAGQGLETAIDGS